MKLTSYWLDTASRFAGATHGPVEGAYDVAVIGGGFCGLSAARRLAQGGASVVLLEAGEAGAAASGSNLTPQIAPAGQGGAGGGGQIGGQDGTNGSAATILSCAAPAGC